MGDDTLLCNRAQKLVAFLAWPFHPLSSNRSGGSDFAGSQLATDTTALWNLLGSGAVRHGGREWGGLEAGGGKRLPRQGRAVPQMKRKGWEAGASLESRVSELGGLPHLLRGKDQ